ncbi:MULTISPECIES: single-stranded-DNA-specific exonuclease RecJ [unclassified Leptolyngbya]|uniref:single-stranded-DNA-specific exonuclease RecJ n=1 Tax=unclassified Leptolyngbya TaxID=2650499 RepID=UPI0016821101|nr:MULTISPECIES: single-stranded-DNA-specific exonuclease RecJ [unclassified Leptolyngbya]MBD1913034.1 single-stranded-DNA-specific exonuclease RecJ [Leptolyngbya sp. FACHB-8]MBD2154465.1 single-stranded-DNA-specific exonuclease RecJ [Leptolyngbya sp. FACHB-16]
MPDVAPWQLQPKAELPEAFIKAVAQYMPDSSGMWAAQLLWQRGLQDIETVRRFINPAHYVPASPFAFGDEMEWAIARLQKAREQGEAIAIWGDFDADGVTATSVLWEGLGQFFSQEEKLVYTIPNRFTESHGLSIAGIERLVAQGFRVIVTCDTGSTNLREIEHARELGIDIIVTDHHTLSETRPPVVALINPRSLPPDHPFATLSGVAVAYKLVEALYETLPQVPTQPLEDLLDLVAIGLIADLVELKGDCRYLAQRGIQQLRKNRDAVPPRPGVAKLLELCQASGDRPTDISFGIGPRINAISRIHGDARFGVELLTSRDPIRCQTLAEETEMANTRRKALQRDVVTQVKTQLAQQDLSTTAAIVLADPQWSPGVLGLVASQIAQEYGRPTILLNTETGTARGSARSVNNIDLYRLVKQQEHLLQSFGGHPFAAGMSLPVENLPLFAEAINRQLRQEQFAIGFPLGATLEADLDVTVADLGKSLFRELSVLEPYGLGNPTPRLLLRNCWFERVWNRNIQDFRNRAVRYIRTVFEIRDDTGSRFDGVWWGHYKDEIPSGRCDAIAELDYNASKNQFEIRLIAVRSCSDSPEALAVTPRVNWILDWRTQKPEAFSDDGPVLKMTQCPSRWDELNVWFRRATQEGTQLALAYPHPTERPSIDVWQDLVGIAKYLSRTGHTVRRSQILDKLGIGDRPLQLGFYALKPLGFVVTANDNQLGIQQAAPVETAPSMSPEPSLDTEATQCISRFLEAVQEEQFRRRFFYTVPLETLQAMAARVKLDT